MKCNLKIIGAKFRTGIKRTFLNEYYYMAQSKNIPHCKPVKCRVVFT